MAIKPAYKRWVTSDKLNRRTCASTACGVVGQYFFREAADVFETENGWARVSHDHDTSCVSGTSEYDDAGNALCNPSNGITDGRFAEWATLMGGDKAQMVFTDPPYIDAAFFRFRSFDF